MTDKLGLSFYQVKITETYEA